MRKAVAKSIAQEPPADVWDGKRVFVGCVDYHGFNYASHVDSLATFMLEARPLMDRGVLSIAREKGNMLDFERSAIARKALTHGATHLFFYDSDMTVSVADIEQLLSRNVDIVSGTYYMRAVRQEMTDKGAATTGDQFPCVSYREGSYITRREIARARAKGDMIPITSTGCGCLLISARALAMIGDPAFRFDWHTGGIVTEKYGEDQWFSRRVHMAGLKMWLDPLVSPDHFAIVRVNYALKDINNQELYTPNY